MAADAESVHGFDVSDGLIGFDLDGCAGRDEVLVALAAGFDVGGGAGMGGGVALVAGEVGAGGGGVPVVPEGVGGEIHIAMTFVTAGVTVTG